MRLTRDEIILITGVLVALALGAAVKHYRDQRRIEVVAGTVSESVSKRGSSAR